MAASRSSPEYMRAWRAKNRERIRVYKKQYESSNPEKKRKWEKTYYKNHGAEMRVKFRDLRLVAIQHLGSKCVVCGFDDIRALHIDHVNSDGHEDRANGGNSAVYRRVLTDTEGRYQLLCANHNAIKMYECNEFGRRKVS